MLKPRDVLNDFHKIFNRSVNNALIRIAENLRRRSILSCRRTKIVFTLDPILYRDIVFFGGLFVTVFNGLKFDWKLIETGNSIVSCLKHKGTECCWQDNGTTRLFLTFIWHLLGHHLLLPWVNVASMQGYGTRWPHQIWVHWTVRSAI